MSPGGLFITTDRAIRESAATFALTATIGLTLFKFLVGWITASVGVFSEGMHSLLDLLSAGIAYFTIREAGKPADKDHPFGHGKIETLSSLLEALLLIVAALFIFYEGFLRLLNPSPIVHTELAIAAIAISLVVSYVVYRHNIRAAAQTESSAIELNALHFLADVVTSAGVLAGLLVISVTGWVLVDPLIALGISFYIGWISYSRIVRALRELTDVQLPLSEVHDIEKALEERADEVIGVHELRTRRSGVERHVDFHLLVCKDVTVQRSHEICDEFESRIHSVYPKTSVQIHVEPCNNHDESCSRNCAFLARRAQRAQNQIS